MRATVVEGLVKTLDSIPQIDVIKQRILNTGLVNTYIHGDSFVIVVCFMLFVSFACWLLSVIMRNYSQVDRIWSIVPFVYCWHFLIHSYLNTNQWNDRLLCMTILSTMWGLRLSYNFYRKGGYNPKDEDYRWPELRKIINNQFLFQIFNITFIALYQNILLLLITFPAYYAYLCVDIPWNLYDTIGTVSFLVFLMIESIADQQQWNYQTKKYSLINAGKPLLGVYNVGFIHTGLFRYSRHPNFFAEMSMWWCFYLFSWCHTPYLNQTIVGTILLTLLFQGSTSFTEGITKRKYPLYGKYQETTSRFIFLPSTFNGDNNKKSN